MTYLGKLNLAHTMPMDKYHLRLHIERGSFWWTDIIFLDHFRVPASCKPHTGDTALPKTKTSQYRLTQPTKKHTPISTHQSLRKHCKNYIPGAQKDEWAYDPANTRQGNSTQLHSRRQGHATTSTLWWIWKSKCSNKIKVFARGQSEHEKYTCVLC
jgi:hypothetical protein